MDPSPNKRPQPPTRLTVSGGKRAEPHLMMAHPIDEDDTVVDVRAVVVGAIILIAFVIAIALLLVGPIR
jgi:hypothetical protein